MSKADLQRLFSVYLKSSYLIILRCFGIASFRSLDVRVFSLED
jgi:hypothetical protein